MNAESETFAAIVCQTGPARGRARSDAGHHRPDEHDPSIPGLDAFFQNLTGNPNFAIRKYPYEFYPLAFVIMMT